MNILAIGNSFSQDATRYLHQIARCNKTGLNAVNLYIGGCSLATHYRNMLSEEKKYQLQICGHTTNFYVSIKEALLACEWDYITFQQASIHSINYETFQPYLSELSGYVKKCAPKAKQVIHQTWAYEQDCERFSDLLNYKDQFDMYSDLKAAYRKAAADIEAHMIITSGKVFQKLIASGIKKIHRDKYHASYGIGRYALGLLWYAQLTGKDIENNTFCDFDEEITEEEIAVIKKCVTNTVKEYKGI